jgi:flavin-dependent dehydrogenase
VVSANRAWDIVVVGAGPAGSTAAITARQRGLTTLVIEGERFPREHVGESLVRLWSVFDDLGVLDRMEDSFEHKYGSGRIWGESTAAHWSNFDRGDLRPYSLQVRRSEFDEILAERARCLGADVRFGWRAIEPLFERDRVIGVRARDPEGRSHDLRGRFVIDGSGRTALLARHLKLRVADPFYPDMSVFAYVQGARRFPGTQAGSLFIESVPWGWFWFIPLKDGEVSVGLVCDRDSRPELKRIGLGDFFQAAVRSSSAVSELLADATVTRPVSAVASAGYTSRRYGGPGWFLAGDSGQFVDPMWATGVANAMRDGIRAVSAAHGVMCGTISEEEGLAFHDRECTARGRILADVVRYVYGLNVLHRDAPFWRRRHEQLSETPEALRERGLGWLAKDPSAYYFREAFQGMGASASAVAELDAESDVLRLRERTADELIAGRLDTWVPSWSSDWIVRTSVGTDTSGSTCRGLEIGHGGERMFSSDQQTIAALELIDGERSVESILDQLTDKTGRRLDAIERLRILAALRLAHVEGAIDCVTARRPEVQLAAR